MLTTLPSSTSSTQPQSRSQTLPPSPISRSPSPEGEDGHGVDFPQGASPEFKQLALDVEFLINLLDKVLREEYQGSEKCKESDVPAPALTPEGEADELDYDSLTCDFCGADIFQSFFECRKCSLSPSMYAEEVILCPGCVAEGRHCRCSLMEPVQRYSMASLLDVRNDAAHLLNRCISRRSGVKQVDLSLQ